VRLKSWLAYAGALLIATACASVSPAPISDGAAVQSPDRQSKTDLLYVASQGGVGVYSYKDGIIGDLVFVLSQFETPEGMCTDKNGDVWITTGREAKVFRFPHGSANSDATIHMPNRASAWSCSVDPVTGNLAIGESRDSVHVYAPDKHVVAIFHLSNTYPESVSYDNKGDLFILGFGGELYEVPFKESLQYVSISGGSIPMSSIAFTNPYLLGIGPSGSQIIGYKLLVSNGVATIHSSLHFAGMVGYTGFSIRAGNVISPDNDGYSVSVYRLSDGKLVSMWSRDMYKPQSAVVSQPPAL
jgi:hypothetical protein